MYIIVYITMYIIADTNAREAKNKTLALQGFLVEVAGFEPAAFWSRTISNRWFCLIFSGFVNYM